MLGCEVSLHLSALALRLYNADSVYITFGSVVGVGVFNIQ